MARPEKKRGFRPIVVDGVNYRWRIDGGNLTADLEVHQRQTDIRGQRLCVNLTCHVPSPFTGRIVSEIIREAMKEGWRPSHVDSDCLLDVVEVFDDSRVRLARQTD